MARPLLLLLAFVLAVPAAYATNYLVGDGSGWDTGVNYVAWASGKTFLLGDTLQFVYGSSSHRVDEVNQNGYDTCSATNAISADSSGNTTISLRTTGSHFFICSVTGHCSQGMKLAVTVSSSSSGPTPGGITSPPPPPFSTSPSGSRNGAVSSFSGMNLWLLGASLVLAPLLGLLG